MSSLEQKLNVTITIGKMRDRNNGSVWPVFIDKIAFQELAAGTITSAIAENVAIDAQALTKNAEIEETPIISCIQTCRGNVRII